MMNLQSDGTTKSASSNVPDPLCINNASLLALQNLQPWMDPNSASMDSCMSSCDERVDDDGQGRHPSAAEQYSSSSGRSTPHSPLENFIDDV